MYDIWYFIKMVIGAVSILLSVIYIVWFGIGLGAIYFTQKGCESFAKEYNVETFRPEWSSTCYVKHGDRVLTLQYYTKNIFLDVK